MTDRIYFLYCYSRVTSHGIEADPVNGEYSSLEAAKAAWEAAGRPGMNGHPVFISVEDVYPDGLSETVDEIILKRA